MGNRRRVPELVLQKNDNTFAFDLALRQFERSRKKIL
jgi:hypothetical protein